MLRVALVLVLVAGCDYFGTSDGDDGAVSAHTLSIRFAGTGHGWARMSTALAPNDIGPVCFEDCDLEMPTAGDRVFVHVGSTQHISSACGLTLSQECWFPTNADQEVTISFEPDPGEVSTMFVDDRVQAVAFASNGDLVIGTMNTLRQTGIDGTPRWSATRSTPTSIVAIAASGRIVVGPQLAAYNADGTLAWQSSVVAKGLACAPDGDAVAVTSAGTIAKLAANDGSVVWETPIASATAVAVNSVGMVAGIGEGGIVRYASDGAPLSTWAVSETAMYLAFDGNDLLTTGNLKWAGMNDNPRVAAYQYSADGVPTLLFERSMYLDGLELISGGVLAWGRAQAWAYAPSTLSALVWKPQNAATWMLDKGYLYGNPGYENSLGDGITPSAAACTQSGRCALAGTYEGPESAANWIGVYDTL